MKGHKSKRHCFRSAPAWYHPNFHNLAEMGEQILHVLLLGVHRQLTDKHLGVIDPITITTS